MSDADLLKGTPFEDRTNKKNVPESLKILTTLTFIGCGISLITLLFQLISGKKNLEAMEKMQGSDELERMPDFLKRFYSDEAVQVVRLSYENRVPLFIIELAALTLCLYGAIQMRNLKKQGYFFWLLGEILPLIGTILFVGTAAITGFVGISILVVVTVFAILYARQLKYLS